MMGDIYGEAGFLAPDHGNRITQLAADHVDPETAEHDIEGFMSVAAAQGLGVSRPMAEIALEQRSNLLAGESHD